MHKFFILLCLHVVLVLFFYAQSSEGFWWWGTDEKKKVDGKWSAWSSYSPCQIPERNDRYPYRFRKRNCTNPAPKNGGKPCSGQARRNAPCSDCDSPLGMESKGIEDSRVTASTFHNEFPPSKARLNGPSAWCAGDLSGEVYLQIDLQGLSLITAVATQGFYPHPRKISLRLGSVSKYQITFSDDGINWDVHEDRLGNHSVFKGNGKDVKTVLNILEPNIAARYVRIHPTARIYFACMKLELYGCRFKCGGYLPETAGDLLAASLESENIDCFWEAHLPKSKKINFDFINFDLPCKNGKLEIRGDGRSYGKSRLLGRLCDYTSAPPPVVSNVNKMWIRFQSNSSDPLIGIYGIYFPNCDYEFNSSKGVLTTPNYPKNYNHNSLCSWLISVPEGKAIMLSFSDFQVEGDKENGPMCENDHIIVTEGNSSKTVIGRFCNTNRPPKYICSISNSIKIQFKSDDILAFRGFNALYKAKEPSAPCAEPSSTIITPSSTISIPSTILSFNFTTSAIMGIKPTAVVASTPVRNSSIGLVVAGQPGLTKDLGKKNDDDDDNGLTTIIIISVFSFIVFVMIIASVVPSLIHGYEKRKREREWLAAADIAEKKNCMENGYEMKPIQPQMNKEKPEVNETTAFLDPEDNSNDKDVTDNTPPYLPTVLKEEDEDYGCDLEYDPTDLNLNVSYEDLGSSFATEMAVLMNNYETISPRKEEPYEMQNSDNDEKCIDNKLPQIENNNDSGAPFQNKDCEDQEIEIQDNGEPSEENPNIIDSADLVANIEEKNDKLQKALSDLKATLSQIHSDSGSIPEIHNPDTNSTVSMSGSQDIHNMPPVDIVNPVWERNTVVASDSKKIPQQEAMENKVESNDKKYNDKDSGCYSSSDDRVPVMDRQSTTTFGTETCV